MCNTIALGTIGIGDGLPPLFLPDIDVYFKGDVPLALHLLERLQAAGARVVKGALIHDVALCFDGGIEATYLGPDGTLSRERYREVIRRHVLPLADARKIYRRAREMGLEVVLTVYDSEGADFALGLGACALKIASSNITHVPLIRKVAGMKLPLIIDTGRATLEEIARAVGWARDAGVRDLIVQHSPAAPPAPLDEHHLRMMPQLGKVFDCPYGLSDHHSGIEMMLAAVALGAAVVEKGICADDAASDIDIAHAARISRVPEIVAGIESVWRALGKDMRILPANRTRPADRTGMVAARDLQAGTLISLQDLRFALAVPLGTIPTEQWDIISGWITTRTVARGQPLTWGDVTPP